jgi:hypothetical protein
MESLGQLTAAEREQFEERAAIVEFLAGWPRPIAEAEARRILGERRWLETSVANYPADRPTSSVDAARVL